MELFRAQEILEEYNESNTRMNLVLFDDALEHLTRVHRIIRMDGGHALLVGLGGSGKQSLARLAAFTAGYEVRPPPHPGRSWVYVSPCSGWSMRTAEQAVTSERELLP